MFFEDGIAEQTNIKMRLQPVEIVSCFDDIILFSCVRERAHTTTPVVYYRSKLKYNIISLLFAQRARSVGQVSVARYYTRYTFGWAANGRTGGRTDRSAGNRLH